MPPALLFTALGLALAFAPRAAWAPCLLALFVTLCSFTFLTVPPGWLEAVLLGQCDRNGGERASRPRAQCAAGVCIVVQRWRLGECRDLCVWIATRPAASAAVCVDTFARIVDRCPKRFNSGEGRIQLGHCCRSAGSHPSVAARDAWLPSRPPGVNAIEFRSAVCSSGCWCVLARRQSRRMISGCSQGNTGSVRMRSRR